MAFASRIGNLFKQTASSNPSVYQAIRCMSSNRLFVGGLSYATIDQDLQQAFSGFGQVTEARIIMDRETGRSRGFGFVSFTSTEEASNAMSGMDGKDLQGRIIRVNYATERTGGFRSGGPGYGSYGGGPSAYGGGGNYGAGNYNAGGGDGGFGGGNYGGDSYNAGPGGSYAGDAIGSNSGATQGDHYTGGAAGSNYANTGQDDLFQGRQ